jgi:hypothetical protein
MVPSATLFTAVVALVAAFGLGGPPSQSASGAKTIGTKVEFPLGGEQRSHSGEYRLMNLPRRDSLGGGEIFIETVRTRERKLLYRYDRGVFVAWAPDDSAIAVSDREASNESRIVVLRSPGWVRLDVTDAFDRAGQGGSEYKKLDHVYFEFVRWLDGSTLLFEVYGWGAPRLKEVYCRCYQYVVAGAFTQVEASRCPGSTEK